MKINGHEGYRSLHPLQDGCLVKWERFKTWVDEAAGGTFYISYAIRFTPRFPKELWYLLPEIEKHLTSKSYLTIAPYFGTPEEDVSEGSIRLRTAEATPVTFAWNTVGAAIGCTEDCASNSRRAAIFTAWFLDQVHKGACLTQKEGAPPPFLLCPQEVVGATVFEYA